ncbi:D-2-hydroxyacid dehydrogenase [Heyndrickxia sporothermodurans]|uniref:D-2-hydroxyacid dehydrogenase n=2 Tax=Heyndrickxia sporothermodurans TaxID=46224 RepID=UPI0035D6DA28
MKVVFTFEPPAEMRKEIRSSFPYVEFHFFQNVDLAETEMESSEVIVTYGEDLTDEHIERAAELKWIMVTSAGIERMPLKAIKEKNILVTNARGIHKTPMAEFTIGLLLDHARNFQLQWKNQQQRIWDKNIPQAELKNQSIAIVGAGAIGQEIARLAKAFRMNVFGINSSGTIKENFDEMYSLENISTPLEKADYVVSILPSTEQTVQFYQMNHFEKMKNTAVFINLGRGDVVKEEILIEALNKKEIAHAYLDVFQTEPLPKNHPLWGMENVTITPHISSTTKNYLPRALDIFQKNLHTYINNKGQFINVIDSERGY